MFDASTPVREVVAVGLLFTAGLFAGCGESVKNAENDYKPLPEWSDDRPQSQKKLEPQELNETVFADIERVETLRSEENATVIDVRPLGKYEAGHVPGAVHSGHGKTEGYKPFKDPDYHDTLPRDVGELQETAREMGVFNDRPVVLYGTPGSKKVGRLFWALEYLGHGEVYIYTPGYEKLLSELGADASTEKATLEGDFVVRRRSSVLATNDDVRKVAKGKKNGILIDTRRKSEYTGEEVRAPRHGYIPKAVYYHWSEIFEKKEGTMQVESKQKLTEEFKSKDIYAEDTVLIPYCQTGTRSSYVYAALRWVGAPNAQNYDGSWARYARMNEAPVNHDGDEKLSEQ